MSYQSEVLADSPVAYWRLGEPSGAYADSSGNSTTLADSGTVTRSVAGAIPGNDAVTVNGSSGYLASNVALSGVTAWTIEAWYKGTDAVGTVASCRPSSSDRSLTLSIGSDPFGNTSAARLGFGVDGSGVYLGAKGTVILNDGNWHHIVGTFSRASGSITTADFKVYVDGVLDNGGTTGGGSATVPLTSGGEAYRFGTPGPGGYSAGDLSGSLDEVAMYATELSAARIAAHYAAATGPATATGTLAAVLPSFAADLAGSYGPSGTLSGSLPALTASIAATVTGGDVAGSVAGVLPPLTASLSGTVATDVDFTGTMSAVLPGFEASFQGGAGWTLTNDAGDTFEYTPDDNYNVGGELDEDVLPEPAVEPVPTWLAPTVSDLRQVYQTLPAPVIGADGNPTNWIGAQVDTVGPVWGRHRVAINRTDVTYWRDRPVVVVDDQLTDPYGYTSLNLVIPTLTNIEARPAWLFEGARVVVDQVIDGAIVNPQNRPFLGVVDSIDQGPALTQVSCSGQFMGRAATIQHQPPVTQPDAKDAAAIIKRILGKSAHWSYAPPTNGTQINMRRKGSRDMTMLGALDDILGLCINDEGESWTLLPQWGTSLKTLDLHKRQLKSTPDFTVHNGAHGVRFEARSDRVDKVNRVYGEGLAPNGERWRNAKYPNLPPKYTPPFPGNLSIGDEDDGVLLFRRAAWGNGDLDADDRFGRLFDDELEDAVNEIRRGLKLPRNGVINEEVWNATFAENPGDWSFRQAHFEPLAQAPGIDPFLRAPDGTVVGLDPEFDHDLTKQDAFVGLGENATKRRGKKWARAYIKRGESINFTLTLTSDPVEMHRLDIRPGMTGDIKHLFGTGLTGVQGYISSVQRSYTDPTRGPVVVLAGSTLPRHYLDLATIKSRKMEARKDPAAQWRHQMRRSTQVADMSGWEGESGAGIIRRRPLTGGEWNPVKMVAADWGTIGDFRVQLDNSECPYFVIAFADDPGIDKVADVIGNPNAWANAEKKRSKFDEHSDWLRHNLAIEWWGRPDERCGYFPKSQVDGNGEQSDHPVTGEWRDEQTWTFATRRGFMWLYVFPMQDCFIEGRARVVPDDGN